MAIGKVTAWVVLASLFGNVLAGHSSHGHHHHARHQSTEYGAASKIAVRDTNNTVITTPNESPASSVQTNIDSVIDGIVAKFVNSDPRFNASENEYAKLLSIAAKFRDQLTSPVEEASLPRETASSQTSNARVLLRESVGRRFVTNNTISGNSTIAKAREIVRLAQVEADSRNLERLTNPRLNSYYAKETAPHAQMKRALAAELLHVNDTVAAAAALVAEADAALDDTPSKGELLAQEQLSKRGLVKRADQYWMSSISRTGSWPYGGSGNSGYKVYRNVKDYGAKGDGKTDDTAAINKAMQEGNRCGPNCGSSTVKGAIVYFPPGVYLISSSIESYYNTQMIGDANNLPILLAASSFVGLGVVSSDKYIEEASGGQWFINQSNFLRQMRNFIIDISKANMNNIAGMHWQVAQATSIQNVYFIASSAAGKAQQGIFAENGSGGFMSDLYFNGGAIGIRCGNQQFTTRNFQFEGVQTAIEMLWDWGWTWKSLRINNANYGIRVNGSFVGGSILLVDSKISNTIVGMEISTPKGSDAQQHFSINLNNVVLESVGSLIIDKVAGVIELGGSKTIESWVLGKVYDEKNPNGVYQRGGALSALHPKTPELMGGPYNGYFERSKPQYETLTSNHFISVKTAAKGDGITDDTLALQFTVTLGAGTGRPIWIPAGSYIVTNTVDFPAGLKIVGECWSQIVAKGARFSNIDAPVPMIRVGKEGDSGTMEMQDLMFTNEGATAGLVLMEWNLAADAPGSAALWDCHFRIGGAAGSHLQAADCPKLTGQVNSKCIAGAMLLHMKETSSAYLENMWAWVADHDLDSGPAQTQIDIYVARGILIETTAATWMYGTASEHCVYYQYALMNAEKLYMGMIQTESPYYLPKPQAPAPFTNQVGNYIADPKFDDCPDSDPHCKASWGLRIVGSSNIHILGAGLYAWFDDYTQACVPLQSCQRRMVDIKASSGIWFYNLYTIGVVEMVNAEGRSPIIASANTNHDIHPRASVINAWLLSGADETDDDDDSQWGPTPDCTAVYNSLDDVVNAANDGKISKYCITQYLGDVEGKILDQALNDYQSTIADGYDSKFQIFQDQIKALIPQQLREAMSKAQSSGFWSCTEKKTVLCCRDCSYACTCDNSKECQSGVKTVGVDCPKGIPQAGITTQPKIAYTLKDSDGFFNMLSKDYGIDKSWITFGDLLVYIHNGCQYSSDVIQCGKEKNTYWTGFPFATNIQIANPKELLGPNINNLRAFSDDLSFELSAFDAGLSETDGAEIVDASSIPVLMTASAIKSMKQVVKIADDAIAAERQETIFNFISAILMLIPGVGSVLSGTALASLRGLIALLGGLTEAALAIYGIVQDPSSVLWVALGLLIGGAGRGSGPDFRGAAGKIKGFSKKDWDNVSMIKGDMDKIKGAHCRR